MKTNQIFAIITFVVALLNLEGILWKNKWAAKNGKAIRIASAVVMLCIGLYYLFQ
ncbi:hypothetical protein [Aedoeadaptatus pacaensis]|uniref:hypothetical protein n=1 Tax=Aedoeadaptatus pacaensis TaxID=1776390 RepID=UPI000A78BB93|nr:hypothetical protein [Peptoniphilus pacaensis]